MQESAEMSVDNKPTVSVGQRLKAAREGKKYSTAEVAVQLRLNKDLIDALETNQWDKLHGRTYARGYYANYVRFLGLPFDEMMALFNLEYSAAESDVNLNGYAMPGSAQSKSNWKWWILIIVVALAAFAYVEWQESVNISEEQPINSLPSDVFEESTVEPLSSMSFDENMIDEITDEVEVASETAFNESDELTEVAEQEPDSLEVDTLQMTVLPTLTIAVTAECWVEIKTTLNQVLISKVLQANEQISLTRSDEIHLLIGRADVAKVTYQSKTIDLTPFAQGDVARLTLGVKS
jgi:cytoskeleton protein RodZ